MARTKDYGRVDHRERRAEALGYEASEEICLLLEEIRQFNRRTRGVFVCLFSDHGGYWIVRRIIDSGHGEIARSRSLLKALKTAVERLPSVG